MNLTWNNGVELISDWLEEADTHPDNVSCLVATLESRSEASFVFHSSDFCQMAALEQDLIEWQNFVEGKLTNKWRELQEEYYAMINSRQLATWWVAGLVTQLLEFVHTMWKYQNLVDHEHDQQGLRLKAARELDEAIKEQFTLGIAGLPRRDHIWQGVDSVKALSASDKKAWLWGITLAWVS